MIRTATESDLDTIDYIYNQAIYAGFCTAHLNPVGPEKRIAWFRRTTDDGYALFVFEDNDTILGWASLSPYRGGREALMETAEISYYVDFKYHGQDIGSSLVAHCLEQAPHLGKRVLVAIIIDGNEASTALLEKFGFEKWGFLPDVFSYEEELRGQHYMGKIIAS